MTLSDVIRMALAPALAILPPQMDTPEARMTLLSIGLQESRFIWRQQMGGGPARGFWQCEQGTQSSRGGIWGFYLHPASRYWMSVCIRTAAFHSMLCPFIAHSIRTMCWRPVSLALAFSLIPSLCRRSVMPSARGLCISASGDPVVHLPGGFHDQHNDGKWGHPRGARDS
jgi:hypothetical protein